MPSYFVLRSVGDLGLCLSLWWWTGATLAEGDIDGTAAGDPSWSPHFTPAVADTKDSGDATPKLTRRTSTVVNETFHSKNEITKISRVVQWAQAQLEATVADSNDGTSTLKRPQERFPDVPLEMSRGVSVVPNRFVGHPLRLFRHRAYTMECRLTSGFSPSNGAISTSLSLTLWQGVQGSMLATTRHHPIVVVVQDEEQCVQVQASALTLIPRVMPFRCGGEDVLAMPGTCRSRTLQDDRPLASNAVAVLTAR